jgi:tRNA(His) 5'-end guanylyltransferase
MNRYDGLGLLYNKAIVSFELKPEWATKGVENSRHSVGNRWTPEANMKRRLAQLGKPKGHGAKISATKQAKKLAMR